MATKKAKHGGQRPGSGRPAIPARERRSEILSARVTREERARCEAAAEAAGDTMQKWMRGKLGLS